MEIDSSRTAEKQPPKLRWHQYRLRSLFVLTTLVAVACSWLTVTMQNERKQKAAAEAIEEAGGTVVSEPTWLAKLLRDDSLVSVTGVDLFGQSTTDTVLVHLQGLGELQWLSLQYTKVTDAGLAHLRGLRQLQTLGLDYSEVTDAGLVHLQGLKQLQELWLSNTKVTDEGVKGFQQALPKCMISRSPPFA
jgi:hypothetical protein